MQKNTTYQSLLLKKKDNWFLELAKQPEQPFFELQYLAKALDNKDAISLHNAAIVLDNQLWLQHLIYSFENNKSEIFVEENNSPIVDEKITLQTNVIKPNEVLISTYETEGFDNVLLATETLTNNKENEGGISLNLDASKHLSEAVEHLEAIKQQPKTANLQENNSQDSIEIEPYHTVDYFASQGIKAAQVLQTDKLSVQLKSFTQWLKSMKKIDTQNLENEQVNDIEAHPAIVTLAEDSLIKSEILTENMANVLLKQGKTFEAIALLEKLSLQDSAKSSYFASRIEQLKSN